MALPETTLPVTAMSMRSIKIAGDDVALSGSGTADEIVLVVHANTNKTVAQGFAVRSSRAVARGVGADAVALHRVVVAGPVR